MMNVTNRRMPVFVTPSSLEFYLASKETHKQCLTIHNPYDFPVAFTITCTDPSKYSIKVSEGTLGPNSLVDVGVRHIMPITENCGVVDKFKISMMDRQTRQMLGFKVIETVLLDGAKKDDSHYQSEANADIHNRNLVTPYSFYLILFIGFMCIIVLCLPTSIESIDVSSSRIPVYLHMSIQIKLFCAFLIGMITQLLIRFV